MLFIRVVFLILIITISAFSAGPQSIALIDRSKLQNSDLDDKKSYDEVSAEEILAFAQILYLSESLPKEEFSSFVGLSIERINFNSVQSIKKRFWDKLLVNYMIASRECSKCEKISSLNELKTLSKNVKIAEERETFYTAYLYEQLRLASLFPKINSEIDTFSADEITGDELKDREFIFTFDDGPSDTGGNTDKLIKILDEHSKSAIFFVLGEKFKQRFQKTSNSKAADLYKKQCVASHGWEHKSHSSWDMWKTSISNTDKLLRDSAPSSYIPVFRPPYGQRKSDSSDFFSQQNIKAILWQIDSQDWNSKISPQQAADRVLTLMLLWRKGIILFHDIHKKAQTAVPDILDKTKNTDIVWLDCKEFLKKSAKQK